MSEYELMIQEAKFGDAGKKVLVEEFLTGIELSVFVLTDGINYLLFPEAKDYKRVGESDTGLNTGGMGAISPVPFAGETFMQKVIDTIIEPTIQGLQKENLNYKGFIFIGLIKIEEEPVVIEYNCRMGDPETEVVLLRLQNDLLQLFVATSQQRLNKEKIIIDPRSAATIMAVSGGYPGEYEKGKVIDFGYLENPDSKKGIDADGGVMVFHAGTKKDKDLTVTNGGRVLAVSALSDTLTEAIELSKEILSQIYFDNMHYRKDIGYEFIS
jgi:phosphoribosylamine--glycine ligase